MIGETIVNWSRLAEAKKGILSSNQKTCGNVIAEYKDRLVIIEGESVKSMNI
jgi:hypothetical protein